MTQKSGFQFLTPNSDKSNLRGTDTWLGFGQGRGGGIPGGGLLSTEDLLSKGVSSLQRASYLYV